MTQPRTAPRTQPSAGGRHPAVVGLLRDGRSLAVQDLLPGDLALARHVNEALSPRSGRLRYFGTCACTGDTETARLTHAACDRISLVGLVEGEAVALAEIDALGTTGGAELALSVADAFQGLGIGTLLLAQLIGRARSRGAVSLRADVLHGNTAMLDLLRHSGLPLTMTRERDVDHGLLALVPGGTFGSVAMSEDAGASGQDAVRVARSASQRAG